MTTDRALEILEVWKNNYDDTHWHDLKDAIQIAIDAIKEKKTGSDCDNVDESF